MEKTLHCMRCHQTYKQSENLNNACVIEHDTESFEGRVNGSVTWPARGQNGFGYDAIFTPLGRLQTFGEMDPSDKHAMSHRADAFAQLLSACLQSFT